jgi:putative PIN family toxin of toxin-antitoxin system
VIVVLDTGIWLSAIRFGGVPLQAVIRAATEDQLVLSNVIEDEIVSVATAKFQLDPQWVRQTLIHYCQGSSQVQITADVTGVCRDPNDDHILECAQKAQADLIVTGDKDLLSIGLFESTRIISARQYIELC